MNMKELTFEEPKTPVDEVEQEAIEVEQEVAEADDDSLEIEVVDDTPPEDRKRKAKEPPADVTDEELNDYSKRAQERIKHFTRSYHDERRAKEAAIREREAALEMAKLARQQAEELKSRLTENHTTVRNVTKEKAAADLAAAKAKFRDAYEAGDAEALTEAQDALFEAKIRLDRAASLPETIDIPLQREVDEVYSRTSAEQPVSQPAVDEKAVEWHSQNQWFGQDPLMTQFAQGLHVKLVAKGVDPTSDEYYDTINNRVRAAFPDYEWGEDESKPEQAPPAVRRAEKPAPSVVAPATRSTAPRKIRLTESEVAVARRLGVSLEDYARQKAELQQRGR